MNHPTQTIETSSDEETTRTAAASRLRLEEALLACMPGAAPAVLEQQLLSNQQANVAPHYDTTSQANTSDYCPSEKGSADEGVIVPHTTLESSTALGTAVLACMPGAYQVPPSGMSTRTAYVDPLHTRLEEEEEEEGELRSVSEAISIDVEREEEPQSTQTNIVSAYRVAVAEPAIVATPFKDNKLRVLIYGVLITTAVIGLIVGLSVGLTTKNKDAEKGDGQTSNRLVSSINVTADKEDVYIRGSSYVRTENGKNISTTIGNAVVNYCEVLPCNEGGCDRSIGKVYKPGCCRGDECNRNDKCGAWCPDRANLCQPSYEGCTEPYCYDCKQGPNGEELYAYRRASFDMKCLRTGVAIGFDDKDDTVKRFYKWAFGCGVVTRGGDEWQNAGTDEYVCAAARIGDGITKTVSQIVPCQIIQLAECGCAPNDVHTLGLPLLRPDKPCKTKEDCAYLCGDAGEEQAKSLCDAFPGIKWWEGENQLYEHFFTEPENNFLFLYGSVNIEIYTQGE